MTTEPASDEFLSSKTVLEMLREKPLNTKDRCDRCDSQAYVHVHIAETALTLMFCGHHWSELDDDPRLRVIRDERAKLNERPTFASLTDAL